MALSTEICSGIALAAGAGGLELGLSLALPRYRTICWCERDAYAAAALVVRMEEQTLDQAPVWSDLVTFDGTPWRGKVGILSAGYPCQPFSAAGKRLGEKDSRHLWPHVKRILQETAAPVLFAENVLGHVSLGLEQVRADLLGLGYQVAAGIFSAAEVGAPQIRKRLFILAYSSGHFVRNLAALIPGKGQAEAARGQSPIRHPDGRGGLDSALYVGNGATTRLFPPDEGDFEAWESWLALRPDLQPALPGEHPGLAHKLDRYRLAGNGVCPLAAAYAFGTLASVIFERQ